MTLTVAEIEDALRAAVADADARSRATFPRVTTHAPRLPDPCHLRASRRSYADARLGHPRTNSAGTMALEVAEHVIGLVQPTRRVDRSIRLQATDGGIRSGATIPACCLASPSPSSATGISGSGGRAVVLRADAGRVDAGRPGGRARPPHRRHGRSRRGASGGRYHRRRAAPDRGEPQIFDLRAFDAMKRNVLFVNVGRGAVVMRRWVTLQQAWSLAPHSTSSLKNHCRDEPARQAPNSSSPHLFRGSKNVWGRVIAPLRQPRAPAARRAAAKPHRPISGY